MLEQLRLLTNLETSERKLLQIVLIGQPELRGMLARPELEQLAQRVIARYHLDALSEQETAQYIAHRLAVAGLKGALPFDAGALRRIHQLTRGVPRRINLLCDRALLGAYATGRAKVDRTIVDKAAQEVFGETGELKPRTLPARWWPLAIGAGVLAGAAAMAAVQWGARDGTATRVAAAGPAPSGVASAVPLATAKTPAATASSAASPANPASAPRVLSLEDLDNLLARGSRDEHDALRALATDWSLQIGDGDPCALAANQDVRCFRAHGGIALLRLLARPSVLALHDAQDHVVYAVLSGMGRDDATLVLGKTPVQVPLTLLTTAWRGDFSTFWRVPPGYSVPLSIGSQVRWWTPWAHCLRKGRAPRRRRPTTSSTPRCARAWPRSSRPRA